MGLSHCSGLMTGRSDWIEGILCCIYAEYHQIDLSRCIKAFSQRMHALKNKEPSQSKEADLCFLSNGVYLWRGKPLYTLSVVIHIHLTMTTIFYIHKLGRYVLLCHLAMRERERNQRNKW